MFRFGIVTLFLINYSSIAFGVSGLTANGQNPLSIQTSTSDIVLFCDVASFGNKISCEIFHDIDQNLIIDSYDERLYFHYFVDGLAHIQDAEFGEEIILCQSPSYSPGAGSRYSPPVLLFSVNVKNGIFHVKRFEF